jgi:class 3 adenylate cyclase
VLPSGTVTFLFTDIDVSTRLWLEQPDAMRPAMARHDGLLVAAIEAHDVTRMTHGVSGEHIPPNADGQSYRSTSARPRTVNATTVFPIALLDDLNRASRAGRPLEPFVAGDKRHVERFGEGHVGGVVERHVVAQFPAAL